MEDKRSQDAAIDSGVLVSASCVLERASRLAALLTVDERNYIEPRLAGGTIPFMRRYSTN
jgi:hypothetical protein